MDVFLRGCELVATLLNPLSLSVLMLAGFADELGNPILEDLVVASWWIQTYLVEAKASATPRLFKRVSLCR